ncbi:MAG TPA: hypothetical protein VFH62_05740 [Dehalococcoidia bacterium]|nr:hypothetical protein [Dehalococcoidia bacterium]
MRFAFVLAILLVVTGACDSDGDAPATNTMARGSAVAPATMSEPTLTPPPVDAPPQSRDGCPVEDEALCQLALDLRGAVATGDLASIQARVVPQRRPCAATFTLTDIDIGCATQDDVSDPVVAYRAYGSDCCYVPVDRFQQFLALALGQPVDDSWRIWGIIEDSAFWESRRSVLLIRGAPADRQVIEFGIAGDGSKLGLFGIIRGTVATLNVPPDARLLPWR